MAISAAAARRRRRSAWDPRSDPKLAAWLHNTAVSGDQSAWVSIWQAANAAQADATKQPTGGAGRVLTFAGNDSLAWPLGAANNQIHQFGCGLWLRQPVSAAETVVSISIGTGGASARKFDFNFQTSRRLFANAYVSGSDGRRGTTPINALPTAGTPFWARVAFDDLLGVPGATEVDRLKLYIGDGTTETEQVLTFSNLGAGATLTTLPTVTGSAILGNFTINATGSGQFNGDAGPELFWWNAPLTAAEALRYMRYVA